MRVLKQPATASEIIEEIKHREQQLKELPAKVERARLELKWTINGCKKWERYYNKRITELKEKLKERQRLDAHAKKYYPEFVKDDNS